MRFVVTDRMTNGYRATMRILITGPSSFTGMYFIEALSCAGHEVVATFTQSVSSYSGVRGQRARRSAEHVIVHEGVSFGDDRFLTLVEKESFDVFCHHGAWTTDYNSMEYDFESAFQTNTRSMNKVCRALSENGCRKIIVSGSIFEEGETLFSPYGLVKKLTAQTTGFYGTHFGMHVSNFVIPNPFGPLDNPKMVDHCAQLWSKGDAPLIWPPAYVRDNIPITLLALGYAYWVEECSTVFGESTFRPSGYISTMGEFVERIAQEFRQRSGWKCASDIQEQRDFSQPMVLINDTPLFSLFPMWNEEAFWNELVEQYLL